MGMIRMKNKWLCLCVGLLMMAGCLQAQNNFIVMRDVPPTPSFTVIPFNFYHSQINFANQIEEALITLGVKTVERPSTKRVTTKKERVAQASDVDVDQKIDAMLFSGKSAQAISIEEYIAYDEIKSDYIISSDVLSNRVKIVRLETEEILATFIMHLDPLGGLENDYKFKKNIQDALVALGINVRSLPVPPPPQELPSTGKRGHVQRQIPGTPY